MMVIDTNIEGKFSLTIECLWINEEGMMELKKNHHLATTIMVVDWGGNHQRMLMWVGEAWWGTTYWYSVGISFHRGKVVTRWSKLTFPVVGYVDIICPLKIKQHQFCDISAKIPARVWIWGNTRQIQVKGHPGEWKGLNSSDLPTLWRWEKTKKLVKNKRDRRHSN